MWFKTELVAPIETIHKYFEPHFIDILIGKYLMTLLSMQILRWFRRVIDNELDADVLW